MKLRCALAGWAYRSGPELWAAGTPSIIRDDYGERTSRLSERTSGKEGPTTLDRIWLTLKALSYGEQ